MSKLEGRVTRKRKPRETMPTGDVHTLFGVEKRPRKKKDHSASNGLAKTIIVFLNMQDKARAWRISPGVRIENGRRIHTGQSNGLPDVLACIKGKFVGIEIKIGNDKMSDVQKKVASDTARAQGLFWEVTCFTDFKILFDQLYTE